MKDFEVRKGESFMDAVKRTTGRDDYEAALECMGGKWCGQSIVEPHQVSKRTAIAEDGE